jgi:hypothetical protein
MKQRSWSGQKGSLQLLGMLLLLVLLGLMVLPLQLLFMIQ